MPGFPAKPLRAPTLNGGLLAVALVGGAVSAILALCLLISGTAVSHVGGSDHLLLKDLALVSFDGLIANNDTTEFLVHLHWFLGSFAWEYPDAPDGVPKVGFASRGLRFSSDIVKDLHKIAGDLKIPEETYDCPRPGPNAKKCENVFFEAWRTWLLSDGLPIVSWLMWIMVISALVVAVLNLAQEWMIRRRPYWMRCRCIILKRYCPCPKGTKEEIEKLDDRTWDKIRMYFWGLNALYFFLPAGQTTFMSVFFLKYMGSMERRLPQGISMNARRDMKAEIALWAAFFASSVGAVCIFIKWTMSRRARGWMDGQNLGQLEPSESNEPDNTLDNARREPNSGVRYTDQV